jgi:manganese/zinc/iron transport system substrate-binding protein
MFIFFAIVGSALFLVHIQSPSIQKNIFTVVCTTTIIADAVKSIGGERVRIVCLMQPGVDPHTYRVCEGDVHRIISADLVLYNGLHLEGRMGSLFESVDSFVHTAAVTEGLDTSAARAVDAFGHCDPHVWHDVLLWRRCVQHVADLLIHADSQGASYYAQRALAYDKELCALHTYIISAVAQLETERRVIVTAHDAFGYFAARYGFDLIGLQGMSTDSYVSMHDIHKAVAAVVSRNVPTIFIESSMPVRTLQAVQEACAAQGRDIGLGDELYSDSLGDEHSDASSYVAMMRHNVDTLVAGLSR